MNKVQVKICGLSRIEDIECVNKLQPEFIGFVFAKSKRQVTVEKATILKSYLDNRIKTVGVFVNAMPELIKRLVDACIIDIVQLHGDEDVDYCKKLRKLVKVPIIKAVRVRNESSFLGLESYPCDYLLFDTYTPGQYGGTGTRFNLKLGDNIVICRPYFIAGGLNPDNVLEVLQETKAFAVDVSGGVETNGVKDPAKIRAFITKVRGENYD